MDFFVYGTLTTPDQVAQVVDSYSFLGSAVLDGLHPVSGRYPTLAPGGSVGGRVLRTDDVDALDRYEGVTQGLYVRVAVPWADTDTDTDDTVAVYVGDSAKLDVTEPVDWPGEGPLAQQVQGYIDRESVAVSWAE